MLAVFTRTYTEDPSIAGCHSFDDALFRISEEINQTTKDHFVVHVEHIRENTYVNNDGDSTLHYFKFPSGIVTVLAEITKKSSLDKEFK